MNVIKNQEVANESDIKSSAHQMQTNHMDVKKDSLKIKNSAKIKPREGSQQFGSFKINSCNFQTSKVSAKTHLSNIKSQNERVSDNNQSQD